jgi:D-sedoheptulose 7-phosphate isomerase
MRGELEAYFGTVGSLGGRIVATDGARRDVPVDDAIAWAVAESHRVKRDSASVFFIGNGGSAAIASHMAIDWMKNGGFIASAFNDGAALTCLSNDLGYDQVFAMPLSRHMRAADLLIAISSGGRSANILAAVEAARAKGGRVMTLSGFDADNPLRLRGDMNFFVPNNLYGFVELSHLVICHAILDLTMGWRADGRRPVYAAYKAELHS